jgi:8-oxo-dGTP diphosphatase
MPTAAQSRLVVCTAAYAPNGTLLIGQRHPQSLLGGFWELPGGKMDEEDADPALAAARELREELGIAWAQLQRPPTLVDLIRCEPLVGQERWMLALYTAQLAHKELKLDGRSHTEVRFVSTRELRNFTFTPATACLLNRNPAYFG